MPVFASNVKKDVPKVYNDQNKKNIDIFRFEKAFLLVQFQHLLSQMAKIALKLPTMVRQIFKL